MYIGKSPVYAKEKRSLISVSRLRQIYPKILFLDIYNIPKNIFSMKYILVYPFFIMIMKLTLKLVTFIHKVSIYDYIELVICSIISINSLYL